MKDVINTIQANNAIYVIADKFIKNKYIASLVRPEFYLNLKKKQFNCTYLLSEAISFFREKDAWNFMAQFPDLIDDYQICKVTFTIEPVSKISLPIK